MWWYTKKSVPEYTLLLFLLLTVLFVGCRHKAPEGSIEPLSVSDFRFDGALGSDGAMISEVGKNHFKVVLGHAPNKPRWSNMLQFEITRHAAGNWLRLDVEFPVVVRSYRFNDYFCSWSYDGADWSPIQWRNNQYGGGNTDVLVFPVFAQDQVFVGHQVPFSYEYLRGMVERWGQDPFVRVHIVGKSLGGLDIYRLEVTDFSKADKKWVHYYSNQHPGENNARWRLAGMLDWLLEEGRSYCAHSIHHFVFMLSPDALSTGWYRTNAQGVDMNRSYSYSGSDSSVQAHEAFLCQHDLETLMAGPHPIHTVWSMHTWQGAVESIMIPGPEIGDVLGPWTALRDTMLGNDPKAFIEPLRLDSAQYSTSTYWTDGPHLQFGITAVLVEGAGNILTREENMTTGSILIKSISEYYR